MTILRFADRNKDLDSLTLAIRKRLAGANNKYLVPQPILATCRIVLEDPDYHKIVPSAVRKAEQCGLNGRLSRAMLTGLWACESWAANPERMRLHRWEDEGIRRGHYVGPRLAAAKRRRSEYADHTVAKVETLLIFGYVQAMGTDQISVKHWRPLIPAFRRIFRITSPKDELVTQSNLERRAINRLRARLLRLKRANANARSVALSCIAQVYATV